MAKAKLWGELSPGRDEKQVENILEQELKDPAGKESVAVEDLRNQIKVLEERQKLAHKVLRDYEDSLDEMGERLKVIPMKLKVSLESGRQEDIVKIMRDKNLIEDFVEEIKEKMAEKMELIEKERELIKQTENLLLDENWHAPGIGDA